MAEETNPQGAPIVPTGGPPPALTPPRPGGKPPPPGGNPGGGGGGNPGGGGGNAANDDGSAQHYNDLSDQILVASENGLFNVVGAPYENAIDQLMIQASGSLDKKDKDAFGKQVYAIGRLFDEAWNRAPKGWRILYERGLLHFLAVFASAYFTFYCLIRLRPLFEPRVHVWTCGFGICGAVLQIVYYLVRKINRRLLRRVWIVQSFFAPVLGVLLSIAIYLAVRGGLLVFGGQSSTSPANEDAIALLCLYAGYKWDWALEKLNQLVGTAKKK
jgi:hypothetical protein